MKRDNLTMRAYPWIVWVLGAGFFFYKYLVQVSPSVMTNDLMKAFDVHGAGLGHLSAFYFYSYLIMQIPVGILIDKYSPRMLTTLAIFICSFSTIVFAQSNSLALACVARAMMGAGAAFAAVSCFKLATLWFSPKRFALVAGLCMTAAMLGAVGGQMPLSLLVQSVGWRAGLKIVGLIGVGLGVIYFVVVKDKQTNALSRPDNKDKGRLRNNFFAILKNKQAWLLSLYSGLAFAPVSVFGGLWGVPFLEASYGFSPGNAAFAVSSIFIGFGVGAPFLGWLSNVMGRRKPVLYIGTLIAFVCIFIVIYIPFYNVSAVSFILFLFGFSASGFFTCFAMIRELFPIAIAATVLGIMNTFDAICEALFEPVVGLALDMAWDGAAIDGVHQFSTYAYQLSLLLLPISLLLSFTTLFFIKETYCLSVEQLTAQEAPDRDNVQAAELLAS